MSNRRSLPIRHRQKHPVSLYVVILLLVAAIPTTRAADNTSFSPVEIVDGELHYNGYANRCARTNCNSTNEPRTNRLRGYSLAGFRAGGEPLPNVTVGLTIRAGFGNGQLRPQDESAADRNHDIIQQAIDTIPARFDRPRAIQLPEGRFYVREGLSIVRNGVVLRGAGQGVDGTVLISVKPDLRDGSRFLTIGETVGNSTFSASDLQTSAVRSGNEIRDIGDGDWIKLSNVATNNLYALRMSYRNQGNTGVDFTVRRGSPSGRIVGHQRTRPAVIGSGTLFSYIDLALSGRHDLYIVFASDSGSSLSVSDIGVRRPWQEAGPRRRIIQPVVVTGESGIRVENPRSFSVGDRVLVMKTVNQAWIDYIGVNRRLVTPPLGDDVLWRETTYDMLHERIISRVTSNEIWLDGPLMDPIYEEFGGGLVVKIDRIDRTSFVGIEDLRIQSDRAASDSRSQPEDQTESAIHFTYAENSWVDGLTCRTLIRNCVGMREFSRNITVQNAAAFDWTSVITGGNRYAFEAYIDSSNILFQRLWVRGGRHDYATGAQSTGPVVFLDALSVEAEEDIGPHHRYATSTLYDNIRGGELSAEDRAFFGTGHGWAGAQITYWNSDSLLANQATSRRRPDAADLSIQAAPGSANFAVGGRADNTRIRTGARVFGVNNGGDSLVNPRSLYLGELLDRKGQQALRDIAHPAQLRGQIYDQLAAWRGESKFENLVFPEDDTYVRFGSSSDRNFANDNRGRPNSRLLVKNSPSRTGDFDRWALIEFDIAPVDRTKVSTARLELQVNDLNVINPGDTRVEVFAMNTPHWREQDVTAASLPEGSNRNSVGTLIVSRTGRVSVDVSEILRNNYDPKIYLELRDRGGSNNLVEFSSSEGNFQPRLIFR